MNKKIRLILNILIVIAALMLIVTLIDMAGAIQSAHRNQEDPVESAQRQLEYKLSHRAYGEIMGTYYWKRSVSLEPEPGMEDLFHIASYAHASFMSRVYQEQKNEQAFLRNEKEMESLKASLGEYAYTADEVDEMIKMAP